jgi:hypothetical protein
MATSEEARNRQVVEEFRRIASWQAHFRRGMTMAGIAAAGAFGVVMYVLWKHQDWKISEYAFPLAILTAAVVHLLLALVLIRPVKKWK